MRPLRHALVLPTVVALAGCGVAPTGNQVPEFTECGQTTNFAFVGETSLSAIGLGDAGPDSSRVGMVWVTADAVPMGGGPMPIGAGPQPEPARMVCVEWPDQSGMAMSIDAGWEPPLGGDPTAPAPDQDLPVGLIGLIVALVVLVGVSVVAFRERPVGG